MNNVLVSIVMAHYNTSIKYLTEAINSILTQTYSNFELIIVDDMSTDNSVDYIEKIEDSRIKLIKNRINLGPSESRNVGIRASKGKYVAIMDNDDISCPDRIRLQVEYMEMNPDVVVCGTWFEKFGVENKIRKPIIEDFELYRCQLLFSNTPITICHSSSMIRKSVIDKYNLQYDIKFPKTQDYKLWVECSKYGRIAIVEKVLLKYRTHKTQLSSTAENELNYEAAAISRSQLQYLGIGYCAGENRWRSDIITDRDDFLQYFNWLKSIAKANMSKGLLDNQKLIVYVRIKASNALKRMKKKDLLQIWFSSNAEVRFLISEFVKATVFKKCFRKDYDYLSRMAM